MTTIKSFSRSIFIRKFPKKTKIGEIKRDLPAENHHYYNIKTGKQYIKIYIFTKKLSCMTNLVPLNSTELRNY
jgi:hypothetical protein